MSNLEYNSVIHTKRKGIWRHVVSLTSLDDETVLILDEFADGEPKENVWIYSERTDIEKISRLAGDHFKISYSVMIILH